MNGLLERLRKLELALSAAEERLRQRQQRTEQIQRELERVAIRLRSLDRSPARLLDCRVCGSIHESTTGGVYPLRKLGKEWYLMCPRCQHVLVAQGHFLQAQRASDS